MNLSTIHVLIIEDEVAIADTLIYACKEAGIATTHYLFGHQALDDLQNNIAQKNNFDCRRWSIAVLRTACVR